MHLRIYQENPAVRAVVHAHPPAATAFAAAGLPLDRPVLQEAVVQLGTVPVAPFALPGSQAVADSVAPYCQAYRALLLEYHGAVTWGTSMEQAHYRLECLEQLATVTLHLRTLGIHRTMPESLVKALEGLRPPGASSDPAAVLLPSERVSPFRPLIGGNSTQLIPNFS